MGTAKEQTFQVKKFLGVNRHTQGTTSPPGEFQTLQNIHPVSDDELQTILGVVDQGGSAMPGVTEIVKAAWLNQSNGDRKLICFYDPSVAQLSAPNVSLSNFVSSGGGGFSCDISVVYVGPGGITSETLISAFSQQATQTIFTLPTDIPDYVAEVDIFIRRNSVSTFIASTLWGSVQRRAGSFPTSITLPAFTNSGGSTPQIVDLPIKSISLKPGTGGNLTDNRIYYLAIPPHRVFNECPGWKAYTAYGGITTGTPAFINVFLPDNYSSIDITQIIFSGYNASLGAGSAGLGFVGLNGKVMPMIGTTPEDMLAVSEAVDGSVIPVGSLVAYSVATGDSSTADTANDTLPYTTALDDVVNFQIVTSSGALPAPLVTNTVYWIVNRTTTTFQLATTEGGSAINLTSNPAGTFAMNVAAISSTINIKEIPVNSRLNLHMIQDSGVYSTTVQGGTSQDAPSSRNYGLFKGISFNRTTDLATDYSSGGEAGTPNPMQVLGAWVLDSLPFSMATSYQLLPHIWNRHFNKYFSNLVPSASILGSAMPVNFGGFWYYGNVPSIDQLNDRLYIANNDNVIHYTNGYVWKPIVRSSGNSLVPIAKYLKAFKDRLCAGGGESNFAYTAQTVGFSGTNAPFNWGTGNNFLTVNSGDQSQIKGFGIISQDLSSSGPNTFLLIGKDDTIFTWNGFEGSSAVISQLGQAVSICGPNASCNTRYGTFFVGRDNAYLIRGQSEPVPIGFEFRDIIEGLTQDQLELIDVKYHKGIAKIAYPSSGTVLDSELWLEMTPDEGAVRNVWSGPHQLKAMKGQIVNASFGSQRDVRVSWYQDRIYQRDFGSTNVGSSIDHLIVTKALDLGAPHMRKLVKAFYMYLALNRNEEFTFTVNGEDGTVSTTQAKTVFTSNGVKQLLQCLLVDRHTARIERLSIANSSNLQWSCYDVSVLFEAQRRRLLR